ncbi:MAG: hypothetical protein ABWZ58_05530 [Acidimicrobiia bacterium]
MADHIFEARQQPAPAPDLDRVEGFDRLGDIIVDWLTGLPYTIPRPVDRALVHVAVRRWRNRRGR